MDHPKSKKPANQPVTFWELMRAQKQEPTKKEKIAKFFRKLLRPNPTRVLSIKMENPTHLRISGITNGSIRRQSN
jgi:hypothetical protein